MAPGPENGAGVETPQTAAPPRIAGRCDLRGSPKGATALSRTFFVPRSPCVPAAPAFPKPRRKPGSQAATGPFGRLVGAGMPPGGERPHKRPHRGKRRERAGRASRPSRGLFTSPFPAHHFGQFLRYACSLPDLPYSAVVTGTGSARPGTCPVWNAVRRPWQQLHDRSGRRRHILRQVLCAVVRQ